MKEHPIIFVAEDDEHMRQLLVLTLASDGYECREAESGTALLDLLAHVTPLDKPDLIVADVSMPGYSGLKILGAIRDAGWSTPVILITAARDEQLREEAVSRGVTAFMQKPFDMADLRVAVLAAIRPEANAALS